MIHTMRGIDIWCSVPCTARFVNNLYSFFCLVNKRLRPSKTVPMNNKVLVSAVRTLFLKWKRDAVVRGVQRCKCITIRETP